MSQTDATEITRLLAALRGGDAHAGERIFPLVYDELRRVAGRILSGERADHTFNPTDLVHEAWLRLGLGAGSGVAVPAADRSHFVGITVRAMRQVLIDHARRRGANKRGAGAVRVTLGDSVGANRSSPEELLALFDAMERLGEVEMRLRQVVEYRYLGGLTEEETAEALGVTTRTVQRDWVKARAWLYRQLYADQEVR
ncbi:MAG: sigma-70 family RNA polymerase sigma factor [Gemmatimonadaceae bacterium]|nr:sigma-70 family RNA polymerase sigma factor [Gemmatimonadaceae bacterium]